MKFIFSFLVLFTFSSCATLFTGTKDRISFITDPTGAVIYIDGIEQCTTPCDLSITRSISDIDVQIKLDGYKARLITLNKEFNVVSILNLGNMLGWVIDIASGAIMEYDQKIYELKLSKETIDSVMNTSKVEIDNEENIVNLYIVQK